MTLATVPETTSLRRTRRFAISFDALLMAVSLAVCAALFTQGGLEAFVFAAGGAALGAGHAISGPRLRAAYSGAFAGLFVGAVFAAFFHTALAALVQLL
ncbi:MAG: hypothetical protein NT015_08235 [Alphaproteobacteria bacterium]|nr:hypothetical protein [Alphaproteobacteria bacterium]